MNSNATEGTISSQQTSGSDDLADSQSSAASLKKADNFNYWESAAKPPVRSLNGSFLILFPSNGFVIIISPIHVRCTDFYEFFECLTFMS